MGASQHGRRCGCAECVLLVQRVAAREPFRESATATQLRDAYEGALDALQQLVEAKPDERETQLAVARQYLVNTGRKIR